MSSTVTHKGFLTEIERVDTSRNGNPRYRATFIISPTETMTVETRPDSSLGYSIGNYRGNPCKFETSILRNRLVIEWIDRDDSEAVQ